MFILDEIGRIIFYTSIIIATITCLKFISVSIKLVKKINKTQKNLKRWKQGLINLDDIHSLTPREFEFWCGEFLYNQGYSKIEQTPLDPDGGKDIICVYNNKKTYIECKRYIYSNTAKLIVDAQICKKLVGAMVHDNVSRGIVITSGIISKNSKEYINSLPDGYYIELYDGERIVKEYKKLRDFQKKQIA